MADVEKTVSIIFEGVDKLGDTFKGIKKGFDDFNSTVETAAKPLSDLAEYVEKANVAIAALAVGGMALAVKESADFTTSLNEINTLVSLTDEDLEKFRGDILKYASDSKSALGEINQAIYNAISLGISYDNSLTAVSAAEKLAVAGKAELNATLEFLVGTMNAYGAGMDEAGRFSDTFFTIVKDGKTTIPELSASMSQVSSIAAAAGIPIETLGAAIAGMTSAGVPTAQAMTTLKAVIEGIISPSGSAEKAAAALGVSLSAQQLSARGLEGVLKQLYQATGGNVDKMAELFSSSEALKGALILGADSAGKFAGALADMEKKAGITAAAYEKMANNLNLATTSLSNNVKILLISIGVNLEETAGKLIGSVTDIFKALTETVDAGVFDQFFDLAESFGENLIRIFSGIAEALPDALAAVDFSYLINAIRGVGVEITDFFGDLDLTKTEDLTDVLQGAADTLAGIITIFGGIVDAFQPYFEAIVEATQRANDFDDETKRAFGEVLLAAQAVMAAGPLIAGAFVIIKESGADIGRVFDAVAGTVKFLTNGIQLAIDLVIEKFVLLGIGFAHVLEVFSFGGVDASIKKVRQELEIFAGAVFDQALENIGDAAKGVSTAFGVTNEKARELGKTVKGAADEISAFPETKKTKVEFNYDTALAQIKSLDAAVAAVPEKKPVKVEPTIDGNQVAKIKNLVISEIPGERIVITQLDYNEQSGKAIKGKIDAAIPEKKEVQIIPEIEVAKIKAQADIVQSSIEWRAKLDIAQAEAAAEQIKAAFESIGTTINSTGDAITSLFSTFAGVDDPSKSWEIERQIDEENKRRDAALEIQTRLTEQQIELLKARTRSLDRGEAIITIDGAGLQPHLEAFMFEVLAAIQIRATAEGVDFLMGV
jgi:TP901 family phage tail tape measure protein